MGNHDLICKSCVYHAGLKLRDTYRWYETIEEMTHYNTSDDRCIVCEDSECGPWVHIRYLVLGGDREA